MIARTRLNITL